MENAFNFEENGLMEMQTFMQPRRTILQACKSFPEGTMVQLINGIIRISPSPIDSHASLLMDIGPDLHFFVKENDLGTTRFGLYDVYLDELNAFQPDILFVSKENLDLIKEDGLHVAPDLIIEILSPSTAKYDLEEKKEVYEQYGVKEYWIVNPADNSVTGYSLVNEKFTKFSETIGRIESPLLGWKVSF